MFHEIEHFLLFKISSDGLLYYLNLFQTDNHHKVFGEYVVTVGYNVLFWALFFLKVDFLQGMVDSVTVIGCFWPVVHYNYYISY